MIYIVRYEASMKTLWDQFVARAKNSVFLFYRDYMEYHADRFVDFSLLFYDNSDLIAAMPANRNDLALVSHGGLTFGGILSDSRMQMPLMMEIFEALKRELSAFGIHQIVYKAVPYIYQTIPANEDLFALFFHKAQLIRRDVSSTIDMRNRIPFGERRRRGIRKAQKNGIVVKKSDDLETFLQIEKQVLETRHGVAPVHTAAELRLLASCFPENIKLYAAYLEDMMLGGVLIYESQAVAHAQYIGASDEGKKMGALDMVFDELINDHYSAKSYFDFGISTENQGRYLNKGLIENKESFGARATVYDFYKLDIEGTYA